MTITTTTALAGIPSHLLGSRSPVAYCQAVAMVGDSRPVFPEGISLHDATTDLETLRRVHEREPHLNYFLRSLGQDGIISLRFRSPRDLQICEAEFEKQLPRTLTIERGETCYMIFLLPVAAPRFRYYRDIVAGAAAHVVSSVPLPGNLHKKSGERFEWRMSCAPGEVCAGFLPREWLFGLPKKIEAAPAAPVIMARHEWTPRSPRWCGP